MKRDALIAYRGKRTQEEDIGKPMEYIFFDVFNTSNVC